MTSKKYCDLLSYISSSSKEEFKDLYTLVDDLCWRSIFTTKRDHTFLMPGKKLMESLRKQADSNEDAAYENLRRLFISEKQKDLGNSEELISFNNKLIKKDFQSKLEDLKEIPVKELNNIIIYKYDLDTVPEQEDKRVRPKKKGKGKKGGEVTEGLNSYKYTHTMLHSSGNVSKEILHRLSSLLEFVKSNEPDTYNKLIKRLDPNWGLSWFILVQPGNDEPDYITKELFNEWEKEHGNTEMNFNHDGFLNAINMESNEAIEELKTTSVDRQDICDNSDCYEVIAQNIREKYESKYQSKGHLHLLEDELRFRYSETPVKDLINDHKHDLLQVNWQNPDKSLVLIGTKTFKLFNQDIGYECLNKFLKTNSFLYNRLNGSYIDKVNTAIAKIGGAGSSARSKKILHILGDVNRKELAKLSTVDSKQMLKAFVKSLSTSQKKILKDIL